MAAEGETFDDAGPEGLGRYVPAVYARALEEAERYCQLLEDHGIPATIDEDYQPPLPRSRRTVQGGVPVLVPESLLEDAKGYMADMEDMNDLDEDEDLEFDKEDEDI